MRDYKELEGLGDYIIVEWPDVQDLMEEEWFRSECFLANPTNNEQEWIGSSAYFVPKMKYLNWLRIKTIFEEEDVEDGD